MDAAVVVETRDGALVDVGPVIRAALVVQARREANPSGGDSGVAGDADRGGEGVWAGGGDGV